MLTQTVVKELFSYNPRTGVLKWIVRPRGGRADRIAGSPDVGGHLQVRVYYKKYYAHRIIWLWMTGLWPAVEIDHRDLNPRNNKWGNLREATRAQNSHNKTKNRNNSSGYKGVSGRRGRWRARIYHDGVEHFLGYFNSPLTAHKAYIKGAEKYFGKFGRTI